MSFIFLSVSLSSWVVFHHEEMLIGLFVGVRDDDRNVCPNVHRGAGACVCFPLLCVVAPMLLDVLYIMSLY